MKSAASTIVLLAGVIAGASAQAVAQDKPARSPDMGKIEYEANCAVCHAVDGRGGGPYVPFLKVAPTDLTVLARNNNGVFPTERVYKVIDGREAVQAHGPREMPVWGWDFSPIPPELRVDFPDDPQAEAEVRNRILWLVDYLYRIQRK